MPIVKRADKMGFCSGVKKAVETAFSVVMPKNKFSKANIGKVDEWLVKEAKKAGLNIDGFDHEVTNFFINHAMKKHGNEKTEKQRGQLPLTEDDFEKLPHLVSSPDYAIIGAKKDNQTIIAYAKEINNGATIYFEEVLDSKKNKSLRSMTMFKLRGNVSVEKFNKVVSNNGKSDLSNAIIVVGVGGNSNFQADHSRVAAANSVSSINNSSLSHAGEKNSSCRIDMALKKRIYTLGPLIHNAALMQELNEKGVSVISETEIPENSTVIIRAHGVRPQLEDALKQHGNVIIDATCSKVKANQLKAQNLAAQGYKLFIAGEKGHAEVQGLLGFAPASIVISTAQEVSAKLSLLRNEMGTSKNEKTAVIAQTTISTDEYEAICAALKTVFPLLEVFNTICNATKERQDALRKLCKRVCAVIIAGDKTSSNTRRLLEIARSANKPAWIVGGASEIPAAVFAYKTVGLSAGASTPDKIIDDIERALT
ncbi:MAG: hypothetical protein Ta2G_20130 [Termitinemataceae bacterium]|nr:MAG: hypothetical protein Ta2G_20130 [Termitinemataceae bacterium]